MMAQPSLHALVTGPAGRFVASGAFNTLATWALYALLLRWLPVAPSYSIAFAAGIALAYLLGRHLVFRRAGVPHAFLWVALIYLGQYGIGLLLVTLWVDILGLPALFAPLFAVAVTLPANFLLQRRVFRGAPR